MSVLESTLARPAQATPTSRPLTARLADYRELAKPRIAVMVLVSVAVGFLLAGPTEEGLLITFFHALLGIGLVAAASAALNQFVERETDAKMIRTANRPLPAGRLSAGEAFGFGVATGLLGTLYLAAFVNGPTAVLSAVTLLLYVLAYTPLKRITSLCTVVGAVPGAMPPVLGWAAAGGGPLAGPIALFGILFLWQFPHLFAIAWIYRRQYAEAGLHMLPGQFPRKRVTGLISLANAVLLLPVSLLPWYAGLVGVGYAAAAAVLAAGYAFCAVLFLWDETLHSARRLLWSSLLYLPLLLGVLTFDYLRIHWSG
jgi:protoheme IX farnesyltransferase